LRITGARGAARLARCVDSLENVGSWGREKLGIDDVLLQCQPRRTALSTVALHTHSYHSATGNCYEMKGDAIATSPQWNGEHLRGLAVQPHKLRAIRSKLNLMTRRLHMLNPWKTDDSLFHISADQTSRHVICLTLFAFTPFLTDLYLPFIIVLKCVLLVAMARTSARNSFFKKSSLTRAKRKPKGFSGLSKVRPQTGAMLINCATQHHKH
jgi:hypothetical protein